MVYYHCQWLECFLKRPPYLCLLISSLCMVTLVSRDDKSLTRNNRRMNGHMRRKMTRELATERTLCVYCTQIGIIFVFNFVYFVLNKNANFM
jgi:hypothetical protein